MSKRKTWYEDAIVATERQRNKYMRQLGEVEAENQRLQEELRIAKAEIGSLQTMLYDSGGRKD